MNSNDLNFLAEAYGKVLINEQSHDDFMKDWQSVFSEFKKLSPEDQHKIIDLSHDSLSGEDGDIRGITPSELNHEIYNQHKSNNGFDNVISSADDKFDNIYKLKGLKKDKPVDTSEEEEHDDVIGGLDI